MLNHASGEITEAISGADSWQQKLSLQHANDSIKAALDALKEGNEKAAKKAKQKALRWYMQAVRECVKPKSSPSDIGKALKKEKAMSESAFNRMNSLVKALLAAKENKKKSDFPIHQGMAINQIMLALDELITGGWDGWHPQKALKWYLNAAASCEDVQDMINELLDYLKKHADDTGITDISDKGCVEAKEMVDKLYKMKKNGAPADEIIEMAEKIKKFLDDEGARIGKLRRDKLMKEAEEEEEEAEKTGAQPTTTTTSVKFTALDGNTNINKKFLGEVETISFVATDGKEIDFKDVDPDIAGHGDSVTLSIKKAAKIGTVILGGSQGIVKLIQDGSGKPSGATTPISTKDGMIEVGNGSLKETFSTAPNTIDMGHSPQENFVKIGESPATVIAVRNNQVAVSANNVKVPEGSIMPVTITTPANKVITNKLNSWGHNINAPAATKVNTPVPITAEVFGLNPFDKVTFHFITEPGQKITPQEITMPAAALKSSIPIAELQTQKVGQQDFKVSVSVEREEDLSVEREW